MEPLMVIISVAIGGTLGYWIGYVLGQGLTRREAFVIVRTSKDETEENLTASERLAMIKSRLAILDRMEEQWLR